MTNPSWYIEPHSVKTDYVVIENIKQWLIEPPQLHPEHPQYNIFWSKESKRCIDGVWGNEFGKWRFMPGNMYYCINYTVLEHTLSDKSTTFIKPIPVDFMWDYAYISLLSKGFSGFIKDDEFTCCSLVKDFNQGKLAKKYLKPSCFNSNGDVKKYVDPWEYVINLKDNNLGRPIYDSPAKDCMVMGSRGSLKSFWVALAELEYNFVFSGAKEYDSRFIRQELTSSQCVGSGDSDKSSELLSKVEFSLNAKTDASNKNFIKWFGIWGKESDNDFKPCPFYRKTSGSFMCPNKKNPFRHEYKVFVNGDWKPKGTKSRIFHVNYSSKKGDGSQAAVGGRYLFTAVEEVGLVIDFVGVKTANDSTTARGGKKFGVQWAMGTSGNIEYVQAAKKVFLNPQDYGILSFTNQFGNEGKNKQVGYFIPYYSTLLEFKDENGNTDYEAAINYVNQQRAIYAESADPKVLREELMNRPCKIEEMWLTDKGYYLPYEEAAAVERELLSGNKYANLYVPVDLYWDAGEAMGVNYKILHNVEPHITFPIPKDMKDPSGCVCIFEFPTPNYSGIIPPDMYCFVGYDNYVEEDIEYGGSLGVTYILKNPKYIPHGYTGNIIVASYIGKPIRGLDYYHEQQEKLLAMYGSPPQGLWFEKNRGEVVREYYIRKGKTHLLCLTPQRNQGSNIYKKTINSFGFIVGNRIQKINLIKQVNDWLLEETEFMEDGIAVKKLNIQRIPCLFLIRQIMQWNLDGNFDAVSALIGAILGLKEYQNIDADRERLRPKVNIYSSLLKNPNIYNYDRIKTWNQN